MIAFSKAQILATITWDSSKLGNITQSKEQNKTPETSPKEAQIYELAIKEFKVTVIKMLSELKEKTDN